MKKQILYKYLPWNFKLVQEDDGTWVGSVEELPGCFSDGRDANETIYNLRQAIEEYVASLIERGVKIPVPKELEYDE